MNSEGIKYLNWIVFEDRMPWVYCTHSAAGSFKISLDHRGCYHVILAESPKVHVCANSFQSCPTLCDPTDHNPPGSSVHGILQARILEGVAMPSSEGSSQPRDRTHVSYCFLHWQMGSFTTRPTWETPFWAPWTDLMEENFCKDTG